MLIKNVNLKDEFPNLENNANLGVYCPLDLKELNDHRLRKTILIIPFFINPPKEASIFNDTTTRFFNFYCDF